MCDFSYMCQAKIIAWIEIITSLAGFIFVSFCTLILGLDPELRNEILREDQDNIFNIILHFSMPEKVTSVAIPIIYFAGEFVLAVFLYRGVTQRNYKHIKIWYIITVTICMTALYFFLPGVFFTDDNYYFVIISLASYTFTAYTIWVVYSLMAEIKREGLHFPVMSWDQDAEKL